MYEKEREKKKEEEAVKKTGKEERINTGKREGKERII